MSGDEKLAAQYYKLSADQGKAFGQFDYGLALKSGRGVSEDLDQARLYLKRCNDKGKDYCKEPCKRVESLLDLIRRVENMRADINR
jgi:hypothetical protein